MLTARISLARFTREISPGLHFADVTGADDSGIAWNSLASFGEIIVSDIWHSVLSVGNRGVAGDQAVEYTGFRDGWRGEQKGCEVFEVVWEGAKSRRLIGPSGKI